MRRGTRPLFLAGPSPDLFMAPAAYGAVGLRATKPSEVEDVIRSALATSRPCVMDFIVNPAEKVSPMVPAGSYFERDTGAGVVRRGSVRSPGGIYAEERKGVLGEEGY